MTTRAGETQDQSEIFRGKSAPSEAGVAARSIPAADLASANRTSDFAARHPDRFFDVGIAEKNMLTISAGLASCGYLPFAATFAAFAALLGCEQIRTDIAYPAQPVRVLAHHSGMSMGYYGSSHHALEDIAIMRSIAGLTVACICDANQLRAALRASLEWPGPMYLRLGRGRDPEVYESVPAEFAFGKASRLRDGGDLTIFATGSEVRPALDAAEMLSGSGVEARVVDMHTVSPIDVDEVTDAARQTAAILTVEEHNVTGGLGSAGDDLAEALQASDWGLLRTSKHILPEFVRLRSSRQDASGLPQALARRP